MLYDVQKRTEKFADHSHGETDCMTTHRVPGERVSLIELYDGPVAEVAILKADASRTCKSLAADLSNASRTSFAYPQTRLPNYVRSISAVKIRGSLSSARPLSTMLRPLADSIQERLLSIDRKCRTGEVGNKDNDIPGAPISSTGMGPKHEESIDKFEATANHQQPEGIIAEVSSDSDVESLGASSFTIQVPVTPRLLFSSALHEIAVWQAQIVSADLP